LGLPVILVVFKAVNESLGSVGFRKLGSNYQLKKHPKLRLVGGLGVGRASAYSDESELVESEIVSSEVPEAKPAELSPDSSKTSGQISNSHSGSVQSEVPQHADPASSLEAALGTPSGQSASYKASQEKPAASAGKNSSQGGHPLKPKPSGGLSPKTQALRDSQDYKNPEEVFEVVSPSALHESEKQAIQGLLARISENSVLVGVAKTNVLWDLRPIVKRPENSRPSLIRFLDRGVLSSEALSFRIKDIFGRIKAYEDLSGAVQNWGVSGEQIWYRRELVDNTLGDLLRVSRQIPASRAREIAVNLCREIEKWHSLGIAHGHLCASNVSLEAGAKVSLLDVGVGAVLAQLNSSEVQGGQFAASASSKYAGSAAKYLPETFAPEIIGSETVLFTADIYGLGRILSHLIAKIEKSGSSKPWIQPVSEMAVRMVASNASSRPSLGKIIELLDEARPEDRFDVRARVRQILDQYGPADTIVPSDSDDVVSETTSNDSIETSPLSGFAKQTNPYSSSKQASQSTGAISKSNELLGDPELASELQGFDSNIGMPEEFRSVDSLDPETGLVSENISQGGVEIKTEDSADKSEDSGFIWEEPEASDLVEETDITGASQVSEPSNTSVNDSGLLGGAPEFDDSAAVGEEYLAETAPTNSTDELLSDFNSDGADFYQEQAEPEQIEEPQALNEEQANDEFFSSESYEGLSSAELEAERQSRRAASETPSPEAKSKESQLEDEVDLDFADFSSEEDDLFSDDYGNADNEATRTAQARYSKLKHEAHRGSDKFLYIGGAIAAGLFALFFFFNSSGSNEEEPLIFSKSELAELWSSGLTKNRGLVVRSAINAEQPSIAAEQLIVSTALKAPKSETSLNGTLVRVAYDKRWMEELAHRDRRSVLAVAANTYLEGKLPKDLPAIDSLHPGAILGLAVTSKGDLNAPLADLELDKFFSLAPPIGPAFRHLNADPAVSKLGDFPARTLAKLAAIGLEPGLEATDGLYRFLEVNTSIRLQVLALLFIDDEAGAEQILSTVLDHPNRRLEHPLIEWGEESGLVDGFGGLPATQRLMILAGLKPGSPLGNEEVVRLFLHPSGGLRAHGINQSLEQISYRHPSAFEVLRMVSDKPELLGPDATVQLGQLLHGNRIGKARVEKWLALSPPPQVVFALLAGNNTNKASWKMDFLLAKHLRTLNYVPKLKSLERLVFHHDSFTRLYAYSSINQSSKRAEAQQLLKRALEKEKKDEYRVLLNTYLGDL